MSGVPSRRARLTRAAKHAELWNAGKKDEWVAPWRGRDRSAGPDRLQCADDRTERSQAAAKRDNAEIRRAVAETRRCIRDAAREPDEEPVT